MITNGRQYRISRAQLSKLRRAAEAFDMDEAAKRIGSKLLAKAELDALRSEVDILSKQLREYDALKSGAVRILEAESLGELPRILIRARIAEGLSQRQLAHRLGLKQQQIQRYESEDYASANLRRLVQVAEALNLNIRKVAEIKPSSSRRVPQRKQDIDWAQFPVREMYRRNWFEGLFSGSLAAAMTEAESLAEEFVARVFRQPAVALPRQRVRSGSILDPYSLLAWECRILGLAANSPPKGKYLRRSLDEQWFKKLVRESRCADGPIRAKRCLDEAGISLVVEPHLPGTYLDGAAFLHGGRPVIGLTLRYDRLDNFWFVLLHELIHIIKHLRQGRVEHIFDDMEASPDRLEHEADSLAGEALIPDEDWEMALARYVRTKESVISFAKKLEINPAIIAGRIRNEADNYVILSEMVGQGEVRKHFPEVRFGW